MSEPVVVPDIAGALIGWRCWGLARTAAGIRLASHGETIWPTHRPIEATCGTSKPHVSPATNCSCGIYALAEHNGFPYYHYDGPSYAVFGQIYLWGEVVKGTKGYRAQYGYPKALTLSHKDWRWAQPLRDAYRVPVRLEDPHNRKED